MSREDRYIVGYTVALISEFAAKFGILPKQAYNYMKRFQGLDYLYKHYGVLHTYSFEDSVEAITEVCRHNGGKLA